MALALSSCSIEVGQRGLSAPTPTFESALVLTPSTASVPHWADLHLPGRLVYINGIAVNNTFQLQVQILDLVTGEVTTIFDVPKYS